AGTQTVRVTDLLGNTVITRNFPVESGNNQLQLDLAGLSPGVYFVTLIADNRELRGKRLIVN
ncbi:MAG: T9SS type A sorting domain-containing protein, partial [Bacteroidia bacterium]|nr:T9SS type A sorting domain-containing protein [Bacteroidia bacterium]